MYLDETGAEFSNLAWLFTQQMPRLIRGSRQGPGVVHGHASMHDAQGEGQKKDNNSQRQAYAGLATRALWGSATLAVQYPKKQYINTTINIGILMT